MKTIIIEDEHYAAKYLHMLCQNIPALNIIGLFENTNQALSFLEDNEVQLVLSDIEMPGLNGMDAVREIRLRRPEAGIIFVTSHEKYAVEAFRVNAVDYLMKPCSKEELETAVQKAVKVLRPEKKRVEIHTFGSFCVMIDGKPLRFANRKAEELLAILVDKGGTVVTIEQATDILWEGRPYDEMVKRLYRKAVTYLNKILQDKDVHFFVTERGCCYVRPKEFDCDYYRLLAEDIDALGRYHGEYMNQFSWAENTIGQIEHFIETKINTPRHE